MFNTSAAIGTILIIPKPKERAESERGFEKSSWRVSLVVIVVASILGTIQEVIYRQAADGVFSSTHHEPKQVKLNGTWRHCPQRNKATRELLFDSIRYVYFCVMSRAVQD